MAQSPYPAKTGPQAILSAQIPYSQEAEEAVIGAVLVNPDAFDEIAVWLSADHFYILRHTYIWEAMVRIRDRKELIDYLTVQEELRALGRLTEIGGSAYLTQLTASVPSSMHASVYGQLVQRAAVRRRLLACADELRGLAMDEEMALESVLAEAEARFTAVQDTSLDHREESWRDTVLRVMDEVAERMETPDQIMGVPSGFRDLDALLCGFQRTDLIIVAGRPAMGKTSMLLTLALNAMNVGARVGFASQEMNRDQLCYRMAAMESGINLQRLRLGTLSQGEYRHFIRAMERIARLPFYVTDANRLTPRRLETQFLRWMRRNGLDLAFVDYLQILSSGGQFRASERTAEVSYFAMELKQIARELRIPLIAAAQLNRAVEERQNKRPMLSDLKESGTIEQEADIVAFLYRDAVYNPETEFPNRAEVLVEKHRNGPTGAVYLHFEKSLTKFTDERTASIDMSEL